MFLQNRFAWVGLVALSLGGCSEHWDSKDPLTRGVGDAVSHNRTVHTIDPWPRVASDKHIRTDGERGILANDRYRKNESLKPQSADSEPASTNVK